MKIRNWKKFQHFKDRRPPWIKLHREILDQHDISLISDCSFRVLIGLWLLASEDDYLEGNIPGIDEISFRLRVEKDRIIKCLVELKPFLIHDDIVKISTQYQNDEPEAYKQEAYKQEVENKTLMSSSQKPELDVTPPKDLKASLKKQALEVLEFLNEKTGRSYRPVATNLVMIESLLKEGASVADCRGVVARKCREWGTDEKMSKYLRPATLFNRTKFEQYIGEKPRGNESRPTAEVHDELPRV